MQQSTGNWVNSYRRKNKLKKGEKGIWCTHNFIQKYLFDMAKQKHKYKQIMLLDDNELDNYVNQKLMESTNFSQRVYISTCAKNALEFLRNLAITGTQCSDLYPQIIFIDLNMPVMDGFQFIETLKSRSIIFKEKIKLVILTSSISGEDRKKVKKIFKDIVFLNKPLTVTMLSEL